MKHNRYLHLLSLSVFACSMLAASTSRAVPITLDFNVSFNTSNFVGPAFYIDFQLNDGSAMGPMGDKNNMVKITNFQPISGLGAPSTIGGASGSLSSSVSITDSAFLNEFTQAFVPGSMLSFHVFLTLNPDAGLTPDAFSFSIAPVPTTGLGDALVLVNIVDINAGDPLIIQRFGSEPNSPIVFAAPSISDISFTGLPLPDTGSTLSLMLIAIISAAIFRSLRRFA